MTALFEYRGSLAWFNIMQNRLSFAFKTATESTQYCAFSDVLVLLLWNSHVISVLCLLCFRARLFIVALWSPAGKGLTSWLSFVMSNCEFVTFPLVSWVRCGT